MKSVRNSTEDRWFHISVMSSSCRRFCLNCSEWSYASEKWWYWSSILGSEGTEKHLYNQILPLRSLIGLADLWRLPIKLFYHHLLLISLAFCSDFYFLPYIDVRLSTPTPPSSFRYKVRLLIWDISSFLRETVLL